VRQLRYVNIRLTWAIGVSTFLDMQHLEKRGQKIQPVRRKKEDVLLWELNDELIRSRTAPRIAKWIPPPVSRWELPLDARHLARIVLRLQKLASDPPTRSFFWWVDKPDNSPAGHNARRLNRLLQEYVAFPYISDEPNGRWDLIWGGMGSATASWQLSAVLLAIELAKTKELLRFRQCLVDKKWFFARTADSKFCCSKCRDTFHQSNPARKEKRRKWAKENYRSRKELELGSRKAAQQKGRKR
jgi:hypothetical protein